MTYADGNQGLGQAQRYSGVKSCTENTLPQF